MFLRTLVLAALVGIAGTAAAVPTSYTYTGNVFTQNDVSAGPSQVIGHFVFDFDNSPQASQNTYNFKSWDVTAAGLSFKSTEPVYWFNNLFIFDSNRNITDWYFSPMSLTFSAVTSISAGVSNSGEAHDIALSNALFGPYASVYDAPGTWSFEPSTDVPEPASAALLGAALVGMAAIRRRAKRPSK